MKKWEKKIAKVDEAVEMTTLDRDATMCQYLMAECFVKSILGYQCQSQKKDICEIAEVVLKRLMSVDGYTAVQNDNRAMQQLRLLADMVACWIAELLMEVAETRKEALEEYCEKRQMKMMEVNDNDDETNSKAVHWKQKNKVANQTQEEEEETAEEKRANEIKIKEERENEETDERENKEKEGKEENVEVNEAEVEEQTEKIINDKQTELENENMI